MKGGAGLSVQAHGTIEKPFGSAQRVGADALSQKFSQRIGSPGLERLGIGDHARGPSFKRVVASERLCDLLGAFGESVNWFRLFGRIACSALTEVSAVHGIPKTQKTRCDLTLRATDFDTVNFGSDIGFWRNVKCACSRRLT
jgi:hypothetical protein